MNILLRRDRPRFAGLIGFVAVSFISSVALSYTDPRDISVRNGARLTYNGTVALPNSICVRQGYVNLDGHVGAIGNIPCGNVDLSLFTWGFAAAGNSCPNWANAPYAVAANTVYYIYVDDRNPAPNVIVTTINPQQSGGLADLSYWVGEAGHTCISTSGGQKLAFVGSIITDGNKVVIPFRRTGDEVHLFPNQTSAQTYGNWNHFQWIFVPKSNLPVSKVINFAQFPTSASAAIVDFQYGSSENTFYSFYIEDPYSLGTAIASLYPQAMFQVGPSNVQVSQLRIAIDGAASMTIWGPTGTAVANSTGMQITLRGYVETINAPSVNNN
jgi:hypothetical protein